MLAKVSRARHEQPDLLAISLSMALVTCSAAVERLHGADENTAHLAAELWMPGQEVAHAMRKAQYPLPDWYLGEDVIDEVRSHLRHPSACAGGADRPGLAAECDQNALPTGLAVGADEASGQDATVEEAGKLTAHMVWQAAAGGIRCRPGIGLGQEGREVFGDDRVEDGRCGLAPPVCRSALHSLRCQQNVLGDTEGGHSRFVVLQS